LRVRPLHDRVLVRRVEDGGDRHGSIIVPDTAKEKPLRAEVIAVGSGRLLENGKRVPTHLRAGDHVLISKWAGTEVKLDGTDYLILKEDEILGVLA
jgi:chaperonin GroES